MSIWIHRWMDGLMDGYIDGQTDGWMDGQMDVRIIGWTDLHGYLTGRTTHGSCQMAH